jgi:hypothetical protein
MSQISDSVSKAVLAAVEKNLTGMFEKGVVVNVTVDTDIDDLLAKANATTDPVLKAGYRKQAKKLQKANKLCD